MKKIKLLSIFLLFGIFISYTTLTNAQQDRIKAGYGYASAPMLLESLSGGFLSIMSLNALKYQDPVSDGSLFVEYNHAISERFSLTGILVHEQFTRGINLRGENPNGNITRIEEKDRYTSIMAGFDFRYLTIGDVTVSFSATYGACYVHAEASEGDEKYTGSNWLFAFQGDLIKLHYGEKFGIDAGFGFGYKGFLTAGISYTF